MRAKLTSVLLAPFAFVGCSSLLLGVANAIEDGEAPSIEVAYGEDARQRYDVYRPLAADGQPLGGPLPVVIFVHGGSWNSGDKRLYRWVGQALAEQGFIAVLPNYGLMPARRWPGFVEDAAQAVAHAYRYSVAFGGDTSRVVLMGHSAGAHIASLVAYDGRYLEAHGLSQRALAGFVGMSGPYARLFDHPLVRRNFNGTPEQELEATPIRFVSSAAPRTLLVMGRDDFAIGPDEAISLSERLLESGVEVDTLWVPGMHSASVGAFARSNRGSSEVVRRVREFVLAPR